MLEMLVAMTATVIMVLFLNQIFTSMSAGVSSGIATSDILHSNRVFSEQIGDDAKEMAGPADLGFLVILQHEYTVPLRQGDDPQPVRSDQIVWIRNRGGLQPSTPGVATDYQDAVSNADSVRIWYGHVLKVRPDGTPDPTPPAVPGPPDLDNTPTNQFASQWVLGRQAMFLDPTPTGIHFDPTANDTIGYPDTERVYEGLTDIRLDNLNAIVTGLTASPFIAYNHTYVINRLWCNPQPEQNPANPYPAARVAQMHSVMLANVSHFQVDFAGDYDFPLAQNGVNLVNGKVVWFSHYSPPENPYIPPPTGPETRRPPVKPLFPNGFARAPLATSAQPIYHDEGNNDNFNYPNPDIELAGYPNAQAAFIFCPTAPVGWPYMLRIRYRVHDKNGRLSDTDGEPGKLFERVIRVRDLLGQFDPG